MAYYNATGTSHKIGDKYTDKNGVVYTPNDNGTYAGTDGKNYILDGTTFKEVDSDKNVVSGGKTVAVSDCTTEDNTQGTAATGIERSADVLSKIREDKKDTLTDEVVSKLTSNIEKVNVYESAEDSLAVDDEYSRKNIIDSIQQAYKTGKASDVTKVTNKYAEVITKNG